jgi:cobalt/nickel transport system ATP-binding protein
MSATLLETNGLGYRYLADRWALRDINLHLGAGERVAVLGANGAGKSTLLLALAGVLPLTEGQLCWEGQHVKDGKSRSFLRDKVGLLLQDPEDQLFAPTVEQDVAFGLIQRGIPEDIASDRAQSALDRLRIPHLAKRPVQQLSLGEKKRVALAGLIVLRPALLLLDEPSSGLDHDGTQALFKVLGELQTDGTAVALSTHDANLAVQWTTRVVVLDSGRKIGRAHV